MRGTVTQDLFRSPSLAAQQMPNLPTLQQSDGVAHKRSPRRAQSTNLVSDQAAPEIIILHAGWLDGEMLVWGEMPAAFFFNDTAPTEIYTLSLHDALPI